MSTALETILKGINLSDSIKASIVEAWEAKSDAVREEVTAALRDEFAVKFEKDKRNLVEALDAMINDAIEPKVQELISEKKSCMAEKVKAKKKMKESVDLVHSFIKQQLILEMKEFSKDRQKMNAKISTVHKFVNEQVQKEMDEFHSERRKLVEDRIQLKINSAKELAETKRNVTNKIVEVSEKFIRNYLKEEMMQLKSELVEAKRNHFGMKIFEAFAAEFSSSFFNERKEVNKLVSVIEEQNKKITESSQQITKRDKMLSESENKLRIAADRLVRQKTMNSLCGSLSGSKRKIMEELLEKVPNHKLNESFNEYLGAVLQETRKDVPSSRNALTESLSEVTGNKQTLVSQSNDSSKKVTNDIINSLKSMDNYNVAKKLI